MAAERMPDFKEINRLIESLQMLDRSFQRITAEFGGHEEKAKQACMAELKKQSAEFLKEIPVEELSAQTVAAAAYPLEEPASPDKPETVTEDP